MQRHPSSSHQQQQQRCRLGLGLGSAAPSLVMVLVLAIAMTAIAQGRSCGLVSPPAGVAQPLAEPAEPEQAHATMQRPTTPPSAGHKAAQQRRRSVFHLEGESPSGEQLDDGLEPNEIHFRESRADRQWRKTLRLPARV